MSNIKILFVCKYNRFRSKIAEAYFKKINKNNKIKVSSSGLIKGFPSSKYIIGAAKKYGLKIKKQTKTLSSKILYNTSLIVIVADNVPESLFKNYKARKILWKIKDTKDTNKRKMEKIISQIMKKVDNLNKNLKDK